MNKKTLLVAGLAGAYVYYTGGDEFLAQLTAPQQEQGVAYEEVVSEEGMPFWQYALINLGATAGFEVLGMAARRAWAATQKKAAAKTVEAITEKVGVKVAEEVGEDVAKTVAKLDAQAAETVVSKVATEASEDVATAVAKLEADGVKAATSATEDVATKVGAEAVQDVGTKVAAEAGTDVAEKAAAQAAEKAAAAAAEKAALKAATLSARAAATASKIAAMTAKATAMGPLGVADLLISAIVLTLQNTVKELEPEYYAPVPDGLWSYDQLPDEAKAVISAIPVAGSLLDLVGPLFQFGSKCPEGYTQETPGGLCFPPCPENYKPDGAFICYKQYEGFDYNGGNGELHTLTSITKHILLDTGTVPTDCGPDMDNDAGICYPKCRPGFHGIGPLCWQDTITLGAGSIPGLEDCPTGFRNDGLTCMKDYACSGGGCSTFCDGNWNTNDGGFCHTHCDPITCNDGPKTVGRLDHGGVCPQGTDNIDGLCYSACPAGYSHTPGMPFICRQNDQPDSYSRGDSSLPGCGDRENISGLCYGKVPAGYTRKVVGTLDQNCPAGGDFGVGCVRESTTREGKLAMVAELRQLLPE